VTSTPVTICIKVMDMVRFNCHRRCEYHQLNNSTKSDEYLQCLWRNV